MPEVHNENENNQKPKINIDIKKELNKIKQETLKELKEILSEIEKIA